MKKQWRTIQPPHQSEKFTLEDAMEAWRRVEGARAVPRSRSARAHGPGRSSIAAARSASYSPLNEARHELFGHIHRCGVVPATRAQQEEWMEDTVRVLSERYPGLSKRDLDGLKASGLEYCRGSDRAAGSDDAAVTRSASAA